MKRLAYYFLRGLAIIAPVALTVYICWKVFVTIDTLVDVGIPGLGFVIAIALTTLIGFLGSNLLAKSAVGAIEGLMGRVPFVRLLYSSTRDLFNAFVGEQRRFNRAVLVSLMPGGTTKMLGFVTRESLERFGLDDHVAVYLPQSYNFAGLLIMVPANQVTPLAIPGPDVLAFIVSGGLAESARPTPIPGGGAPVSS